MKFSGELKFPEIDHPGVPVNFIIEGSQAELFVEGESLGRWSLYDVHARRLVANAFQIDLDGTEATFVAEDPIDFAYRGVEHMAETWAKIKSKGIATRTLAVRKSRKGTIPGRIEDMKTAMVSNLETASESRHIAGEEAMPEEETAAPEPAALAEDVTPEPAARVSEPEVDSEAMSEEWARLEEERQRLAEERARFEEERRIAEQREADRVEAYRLEMERLEAEREALRQQAEEAGTEAAIEPEMEDEAAVTGPEAEPALTEPESEEVLETASAEETDDISDAEAEPAADDQPEPEEPQLEEEPAAQAGSGEAPEEEEDPDEEAEPEPGVVDLSDLEEEPESTPPAEAEPVTPTGAGHEEEPETPPPAEPGPVTPTGPGRKEPEPAMAGATRDRSGLMGAVRAAFRSGSRDHEHRFIEAPGGMGITRYVCEECGYVSISV